MLGLSSDDSSDSYRSIDYALYADSGIGNKFVIYESSVRKRDTSVVYAAGDYMKVTRSGTQIKYYHIKASDGPHAKGTLLYTSSKTSNANTKLFLDSSFHNVGAKLTDMQIFSGNNLALSVDVYAPKPTADAWNIEGAVNDKGAFTLGSKVKITLALDENITLANVGSNKIVVAGKDFLLTGTNGTVTKTLEFVYTVQLNDKIDTAFNIDSKDDIVLNDIQDVDGNNIDFGNISNGLDITPISKNLVLNSKGLATITTNVTSWHNGGTAANISRMTDGNTSSSGVLDYAVHPNSANGKYILFDFKGVNYNNGSFKLYNRKAVVSRINGSIVDFLKDGVVVSTHTISNAGNIIEITPVSNLVFDQVKLTFSGDAQNFREVKIFGKNTTLLIDA
ncbi:hypothetical protein, partial [thiotrophic endosymbiont of Bathymodiolus puteoserpentis (Logatchev)]|uniref:hypothetical protein n=1 Tax=thiotrophic endosymbiont of Bathymodiolus puteoserpentis (Logatchev) TaxID=343240 RepID=UPI0015D5FB36